jgi:hypothetical protein
VTLTLPPNQQVNGLFTQSDRWTEMFYCMTHKNRINPILCNAVWHHRVARHVKGYHPKPNPLGLHRTRPLDYAAGQVSSGTRGQYVLW